MFFYLVDLLIIISFWPIHKINIRILNRRISGESIYLFLIYFMFWIVMSFRASSVGTDTSAYLYIYYKIMNSDSFFSALYSSSLTTAPVYVGYLYLLSKTSSCLQLSIIVNSTIICFCFFLFIRKESKNYMISCFLFVVLSLYSESMNGTRQFVATSIMLISFCFIIDNKSIKGWTLFVLSIGIHNTVAFMGFIFILFIFFKKEKKILTISIFALTLSLAIVFFLPIIIQLFICIFPYYSIYIDGVGHWQIFQSDGIGRIIILYCFLLTAIFVFAIKSREVYSISFNFYFFSCFFCCVTGAFFSQSSLFNRMLLPFFSLFIIFFSNAISFQREYKKIVLGVNIGLLVYYLFFLYEDKSSIIPYQIVNSFDLNQTIYNNYYSIAISGGST